MNNGSAKERMLSLSHTNRLYRMKQVQGKQSYVVLKWSHGHVHVARARDDIAQQRVLVGVKYSTKRPSTKYTVIIFMLVTFMPSPLSDYGLTILTSSVSTRLPSSLMASMNSADMLPYATAGGSKVKILGRYRNVIVKGRVQRAMYKGELVKISELRKIEKDLLKLWYTWKNLVFSNIVFSNVDSFILNSFSETTPCTPRDRDPSPACRGPGLLASPWEIDAWS